MDSLRLDLTFDVRQAGGVLFGVQLIFLKLGLRCCAGGGDAEKSSFHSNLEIACLFFSFSLSLSGSFYFLLVPIALSCGARCRLGIQPTGLGSPITAQNRRSSNCAACAVMSIIGSRSKSTEMSNKRKKEKGKERWANEGKKGKERTGPEPAWSGRSDWQHDNR